MHIMRSEWESWKLRNWWIGLIILIEITLLTTIAALVIRSKRNDGLRTVSSISNKASSSFSLSTLSGSQGRWNALPAVFMALFGIGYASIITAYASRQPFVELSRVKCQARSAGLTILLDYPRYSVFYSWAVALKNGHYILGCSMLLVLLSSIILVPLTAAFSRAFPAKSSSSISLQPLATLVPSIEEDVSILRDPSFHTHAYYAFEAPLIPWMTATQVFESFEPIDIVLPADLTTDAVAYYTKVKCVSIPPSEMNFSFETKVEGETYITNFTQSYINFVDRGCRMRVPGQTSNAEATGVYIFSWAESCSEREENPYRIGIRAKNNTSMNMSNATESMVISCIPTYWKAVIPLTISIRQGATGPLIRILSSQQATEEYEIPAINFKAFHNVFQMIALDSGYAINDPIVDAVVNEAGRSDDEQIAKIGSDSYRSAMEEVFSTLFASTVSMRMLPHSEEQALRTGVLTTNIFRLYINEPVAYILLTLIFLMTLCTAGIFRSMCVTRSILTEEPVGLLGRARVLLNSDVGKFVTEFYDQHHQKTSIVKYVNKYYTVDRSKCYFDDDGWGSGGIRLQDLDWRWHVKSRENVPSDEAVPLNNV